MRWVRWLALAAALWSWPGCAREDVTPAALQRVTHAEVVARRSAYDTADTIPLFRPHDLVVWGDTIVVADPGNDWLVVYDSALRHLAVIGRTGSGPDEFSGPLALARTPTGLAVADAGNMRYVLFDRMLNRTATVPAPQIALNFASSSDGALYVSDFLPGHYFTRIGPDGGTARFGDRVEPFELEVRGSTPQLAINGVAITAGDTVHVLDNRRGTLVKLSPDGRVALESRLPVVSAADVERRSDALARSMGASFAGGFAKDLVATADGRLLVLLSDPVVWALLVDPRDYSAVALQAPDHRPASRLLRSAITVHYAPPTLVVLTATDVARLRVVDAPAAQNASASPTPRATGATRGPR